MDTDRTIEVIVEIPRGSRNKYEYDHERHLMRLDRRLFSATFYPADYGFVPDTLAEDGDPLDVLVLIDEPTFPGCLVESRPVGVFWMTDEKGPDAKIISVACGDPMWETVRDLDGLPPHLTFEIAHFFDVYKDLEPDKLTKVRGFDGVDAALGGDRPLIRAPQTTRTLTESVSEGQGRSDCTSDGVRITQASTCAFAAENSSSVSAPDSWRDANCCSWVIRSVAPEA